MSKQPLYLDYASTTPVAPFVAKAMIACLEKDGNFANPASRSHMLGWQAEAAVEDARRQLADLINSDPREIVWTSGATEANNLAIKGSVQALLENLEGFESSVVEKIVVITSQTEHKAVLDTCAFFETDSFKERGIEVVYLKPQANGVSDLAAIKKTVSEFNTQASQASAGKSTEKNNTRFIVSLMHMNNETGAMNDIARVGAYCRRENILFHVDAAQSVGKVNIDVNALNVDLLSISAHKFYGPKGVGALFVRRSPEIKVKAQIHGGGHERGMRSGTLATHQLVGFGAAAELAKKRIDDDFLHLKALKQQFVDGLNTLATTLATPLSVNGDVDNDFPGITNVCFAGVDGETLMMSLRGLAISSGSACTSASVDPSYVLRVMGLSHEEAQSSLRFSFGRDTSAADITRALGDISKALTSLTKLAW